MNLRTKWIINFRLPEGFLGLVISLSSSGSRFIVSSVLCPIGSEARLVIMLEDKQDYNEI
jgi:hypothetical protein